MPFFSGSISRCRVIIDGDNVNAQEREGSVSFTFSKTLELRDLTAPENAGGGRAQPTGSFDGQPGDGG